MQAVLNAENSQFLSGGANTILFLNSAQSPNQIFLIFVMHITKLSAGETFRIN
jgi:hypothetical protein